MIIIIITLSNSSAPNMGALEDPNMGENMEPKCRKYTSQNQMTARPRLDPVSNNIIN